MRCTGVKNYLGITYVMSILLRIFGKTREVDWFCIISLAYVTRLNFVDTPSTLIGLRSILTRGKTKRGLSSFMPNLMIRMRRLPSRSASRPGAGA